MVVNPPSADGSLQPVIDIVPPAAVDQCDINSVPRAETQVEVDQADTNSRSESPGAEMQEEVDQAETMNTSSVSESPGAEMQEEVDQGETMNTSSVSEPPRAVEFDQLVWNASKSFVARVILLAGTCDLPAKCLVQNFKQFNGFYGCGKCLQPGSTYTLGQSSRKHVYFYEPANPTGPLRSKEQTSDDVKWFKENGTSKNGVLGPSWFHCLRHLDMIKGTGLDYMHGCLLGVTGQMLSLWLNTEHKNDKFYIGNHIAVLNRRLLSIQPPNEISRCPRSFTDRKHWKASEYWSFLFYYSLPVLFGVLPLEYFHHFALFAIAVRLFASESISPSELTKGTLYLDFFCKKFGEYYSEQYIGINLHSLLHLSSTVEELGPLWAYSCFAFEGFNGILLKNVHETQGIALQCMRTYNMTQAFPFKEQIPLGEELEQLKFVNKTTGMIALFQHSNHIRPSGKAVVSALSSEEKRLLDNFLPESLMSYKQYQRIRIGMEVYSTQESSTLRKRCNSCVFFKNYSYSFGQVQNFVEVVTNVCLMYANCMCASHHHVCCMHSFRL